jgi:hypothetical protein
LEPAGAEAIVAGAMDLRSTFAGWYGFWLGCGIAVEWQLSHRASGWKRPQSDSQIGPNQSFNVMANNCDNFTSRRYHLHQIRYRRIQSLEERGPRFAVGKRAIQRRFRDSSRSDQQGDL